MKLKNPKYYLLKRLGRPAHWVKEYIEFPTLTAQKLPPLTKSTTIPLYPFQMEILDKLRDEPIALIKLKMGGGKSVIAIALHEITESRTLIVLHRNIMIKQFIAEFDKFNPETSVSVYADGKKDMSGDVVLTSFATFRKKYEEFVGFGTLIVDEVDEYTSTKSLQSIINFNASRKYGMTGTIRTRFDECNKMEVLPMFFSGTMVEGKHLEEASVLDKVYYYIHNGTYKDDRGTYVQIGDWIEFRKALDANKPRKNAQLKFILDNSNDTESTLLLFDRVSDSEAFYKVMQARKIKCNIVTGERDDRDKQIKDFKKDDGYLIGTYSILSRGFNCVPLKKVFILYPTSAGNTFVQTIGRVVRKYLDQKSYIYIWSERQLKHQIVKQKKVVREEFGKDMIEIKNNKLKL